MFLTALKNFKQKISNIKSYNLGEVHAIYATNTILGLAQSLLGIFVPIFIFNLSKSFLFFSDNTVTNGFLWIISYFAVTSISVLLSIVVFEQFIFKKTLKKTLFVSELFLVGCYLFLSLSSKNPNLLFLSAIFGGIHTTLYWIPYHIFFVKRADDGDRKYGTETGKRDFLVGMSASFGPLLGALIISQLGFPTLYAFTIFLLLFASLPIILFVKENKHRDHSFKDVYLNYLVNKKYLKTTIALGGAIVSNTIFAIFWSLMLYFGLQSFVEIGLMTTFSGIMAMILLIVVGKMVDSHGKKGIHFLGVAVNTILHLTRPFFKSTAFLYGNGIIDNINSPAYGVPFNAAIYEKSLEGSVSDFLVYREIVLHLVRLIVLIILGLVLYYTDSWVWTFYLGAVGSALSFLVNF